MHIEESWTDHVPHGLHTELPTLLKKSLKLSQFHILLNKFENLHDYGNFFPIVLNVILSISLIDVYKSPRLQDANVGSSVHIKRNLVEYFQWLSVHINTILVLVSTFNIHCHKDLN